jgi:hypothetical protein
MNTNVTTRKLGWSWDRPAEIQGFALYLSTSKLDAAFESETLQVSDPDTRSVNFTGMKLGVSYYVKVATLRGEGEGELYPETKSLISDPIHLTCAVGGWCNPRDGTGQEWVVEGYTWG